MTRYIILCFNKQLPTCKISILKVAIMQLVCYAYNTFMMPILYYSYGTSHLMAIQFAGKFA